MFSDANKVKLYRFLSSTMFSVVMLTILFVVMTYVAISVTKSLHKEPDFGGVVTLRQTDVEIKNKDGSEVKLSRQMIYDYITRDVILLPIAQKCAWEGKYEDLVKNVDVKERISSNNSFSVIVNTGRNSRSQMVAMLLAESFLSHYRRGWFKRGEYSMKASCAMIKSLKAEIIRLERLKASFPKENNVNPLNSEIEMKALNDQLIEAQKQFLTAYGTYIQNIEQKIEEAELKYNIARRSYTDESAMLRPLKNELLELRALGKRAQEKFQKDKPNVYRLTEDLKSLPDLPASLRFYYDNLQTLQQLRLAVMIDSIIEDKKETLAKEIKKRKVIERLLASGSCDVFIRGGR